MPANSSTPQQPPCGPAHGWQVLAGHASGFELVAWYFVIVTALLLTAWLLSPAQRRRRPRRAERDRYEPCADVEAASELWSDCPDCDFRCQTSDAHQAPVSDKAAGHIGVVVLPTTTLEDPLSSTAEGLVMPGQHRTMLGYAPLRAPDLIARVEAERAAERTRPRWPTFTDFGHACVTAHAIATRRASRWRAHRTA